jgi:hypothetical protein
MNTGTFINHKCKNVGFLPSNLGKKTYNDGLKQCCESGSGTALIWIFWIRNRIGCGSASRSKELDQKLTNKPEFQPLKTYIKYIFHVKI